MKSTSDRGVAYHDKLANKWSSHYSNPGFQKRMQLFKCLLGECVESGGYWLDAGCGSGVLSQLLLDRGVTVLGIDASKLMLDEAEQHLVDAMNDGRIGFQQIQTVERLGALDTQFDGVLCSSVIEYVQAPQSVLMEFRKVLKPGGILVISVPNKFSLVRTAQKVLRVIGEVFKKDYAPYLDVSVNDYSKTSFQKTLVELGFECIQYEQFDPIFGSKIKWWPGSLHVFAAKSNPKSGSQ